MRAPSSYLFALLAATASLCGLFQIPSPLVAQATGGGSPAILDGAPPPILPATVSRDDLGRATIRAFPLDAPLRLDGVLDEAIFEQIPPVQGLIQVTPDYGAAASEPSDIWVLYDATHMYVVCRCWDSAPPEQWVANEMRRDANGLRNNDHFGVLFDTFYDRRSAFVFYTNPLGGRADYSIVDEGGSNSDWNPVWEVATGRFNGGWVVEMAIPFKSLRYQAGADQVWGIQFRRSIRRRNEWAYLNPVPPLLAGPQAFNRVSAGGTLVGLNLPEAGRNVELRPFASASSASGAAGAGRPLDGGLDLKYGITAQLTADFTLNTDFAQVEVDEQQVNLSRFSLFFPEKREFFLEGSGVFDFGRSGDGGGPMAARNSDAPFLFYSRRIGLEGGSRVPIEGGARVTGKVGDWGVGAMSIRTGGEDDLGLPSTDFQVLRAKRDVFRRSTVGAMVTHRSATPLSGGAAGGANQSYGLDGTFRFFDNLALTAYWARTEQDSFTQPSDSWRTTLDLAEDLYGVRLELLSVDPDHRPGVGLARRTDFRKGAATLRYSPRPQGMASIRKLTWELALDYFEGAADRRIQSREQSAQFEVDLDTSDRIRIAGTRSFERLDRPFAVTPGLTVAPGNYPYQNVRLTFQSGAQRRVSGNVSLQHGSFYDGTLTSLGVSGARIVASPQLSLEPGVTLNRLDLAAGRETQQLLRWRIDYAFSPLMFSSALVQFNAIDRAFSSNLRFRWEYRPGSELFLVWTDSRRTGFQEQAFVVKATRLLQF
jgi:hypothetical protein